MIFCVSEKSMDLIEVALTSPIYHLPEYLPQIKDFYELYIA